ncbi:glycosyltransferase family 2 protein [Flavobacterium sp.]|uniref:glycosyltransferase family 2 protein n=1 Tax=Flavobacterium sp. TaxID=239 RepID=UPI00374DF1F3
MIPLVSIIIPNYNHKDFLKERLDSIFNQTFQDFEVLLFDDASTDGSLAILKHYENHPKVSHFIVNKKNSGSPFKQWRKGLELAKAQYIWIAETDDFAETNFLETQLETISNHFAVVAKTITVEGLTVTKKEVVHPIFNNNNTSCTLDGTMFFSSPIKNVSCVLFRKPSLEELNKMTFDQFSYMGDQVFYYEFFKNKSISFNPNTTSYFRKIDSSVSSLSKNKGIDYFKKYFDQHLKFLQLISPEMGREKEKKYLKKHFNKIKNRTYLSQRINLKYVSILLKYYSRIL